MPPAMDGGPARTPSSSSLAVIPGQSALVERDGELAALTHTLEAAIAGQGRAVLVEGPAGIGKSRLLGELRHDAVERGALVLVARGSELERAFPFGAVRQLFEAALAAPGRREQALAGAAAPAAAVLGALEDAPGQEPSGDVSFAALHGLFWLSVNLAAERPLVLAVDDLQWCDRPSLRFVAYLVRRLEGLPILLAATVRTGDAVEDGALLGEISSDPATMAVRPGPLSLEAVRQLIAERLGDDPDVAFAQACHRSTGGNPLLLRELLTALATDGVRPDAAHAGVVIDIGPRAVSRTVLLRLARLPAEAVAVARSVAVLGEAAALPTVTAYTGLAERAVAEAIAALARADIVSAESPLGFVHPLVRDAVYRELAPGERELQHAHAAEVLRERAAPAELVAAQLLRTSPRGDAAAVATLRDAATSAVRKGAPDSAIAYLRRALEEPPGEAERAGVLLELGLAEGLIDGAAAAEHLEEAYGAVTDPARRAFTANVLARVVLFARGPEAAREIARQALADLPEELVSERARLRGVALMATHFGAGDISELEELVPYRTAQREDLTNAGESGLAGLAAWAWLRQGGPADRICELSLASLASGELVREDNGLLSVPPYVALAALDHPETLEQWEQALVDGHRQGSLYGISALHLWRGYALLLRGELPEAVESLELATEEFRNWGHGFAAELYTASLLCAAHVDRGDLEAARAALAGVPNPAVARVGPLARTDGAAFFRHASMRLLLAERRYAEALDEARGFPATFPQWRTPTVFRPLGIAAEALMHLGRGEEAVPLAEEELTRARAVGAPRAQSESLRTLAALEGDAGLPRLEEALRIVEPSVARLELARVLADLGSALRRARRPSDAREPLRRALELSDACGALALVEHVRAELAATGARPRTTAAAGVESLTASERRVVQFAVEGQTNRDIAQALFVTPKTVEVHLSNAYRKLGVRSRRDLAAVVGR